MGLDEAGLERLFNQHYAALAAFANRLLSSPEDAREAVQDVYVSLWKNRENLDVEGNLKAYLYTSTRNRCISVLRKRQLHTVSMESFEETLPSDQHGVEAEMAAAELQAAIYEEISMLPEKCREIFLLSRRDGLTYSQIAQKLDIAPKTVENQIGIALKRIRQLLFKQGPSSDGGGGLFSLLVGLLLPAATIVGLLRPAFLLFRIKMLKQPSFLGVLPCFCRTQEWSNVSKAAA